MTKCAIVGPLMLQKLVKRYDGIGNPLTRDEEQILMAALYFESEQRGGVVSDAQKEYLKNVQSTR